MTRPGQDNAVVASTDQADVVVLGAGMAGLCAAARAAQSGARVVVMERAPVIGGSAAFSHGNVWTVADTEQLAAEDPGEFRVHADRVVTGFAATADWLAAFGGALGPRESSSRRQWQRFDVPLIFLRLAQMVTSTGGEVLTGARVTGIGKDAAAFRVTVSLVPGAGADGGGGAPAGNRTVRARSVVIATGGRQADPAVRAELTGGARRCCAAIRTPTTAASRSPPPSVRTLTSPTGGFTAT